MMPWVLLGLDLFAILGFSIAFYYSLRIYNEEKFSSPIPAIRSTALFTGVIWGVFLAFASVFEYPLLEESASYLLSMMSGIFAALILAKSY